MTDLKLYEFAEADWIVARNLREAVRCWISYSGETKREALENFRVVPRDKWNKFRFRYDEAGERTCSFSKRIREVIETKEEAVPFFLATSEF
jgi:hypothetical protein